MELRLADTLSVLKPTDTKTALRRACLHSGPSARDGWERWREGRSSSGAALCAELATWRTLLPLLERSVARSAIDVGADVWSYLRATSLREELRADRYRTIAAAALTALEHSGITAMVVRGAALALAEDVALGGITAATQGDVIGLWRAAQSWRGRLRLARWVMAPTPAYLRNTFDVPTDWLIPLCYLYRPARLVAGRLARPAPSADPPAQ